MSYKDNNNYMKIVIIILIFFIVFLNFLLVDLYISENQFIIKLYKIKIFSLKNEKYYRLINKLISSKEKNNVNVIQYISFLKVNLNIETKVNNYQLFLYSNVLFLFVINNIYPLIKKRIPSLNYKLKKSERNSFQLEVSLIINVFKIIFALMKGKKYVTKRY